MTNVKILGNIKICENNSKGTKIMTQYPQENQLINALQDFAKCHNKYNEHRPRTSTEKEIIKRNEEFAAQYQEISLERGEKANYKTFCAHGTNGWALFSAWAFANGQLLPGNEIKLIGMFANSGENRGSTGNGRNFVSTIPLLKPLSAHGKYLPSLKIPSNWSGSYNGYVSYEDLQKKFTEKYSNRNQDNALKEKIKQAFNVNMQEVYRKLSCMKVVIIGDGIGNAYKTRFYGAGDVPHEVLYERVNIRAVIVEEKNKDFVQKLLKLVNPKLFETIALFTTEEMEKFEQSRNNPQGNGFIADFINAFKDRLPFKFFDKVKIIGANKCFFSKARSKKQSEYYGVCASEVEFLSGFVLYNVESSVDDSKHIKPFIKKIADIYKYINYFNNNRDFPSMLKRSYDKATSAYPSVLAELNSYKGHNKCELEKMLKPVREFLDNNRERMAEIMQEIALEDIQYLFPVQESVQQKKNVHFANGVQNYQEETPASHTKQPERKIDKGVSNNVGQIPNLQTDSREPQASTYDNTSMYCTLGAASIGFLAMGVLLCTVGMPEFGGIFIAGAVMCALIVGIGQAYEKASGKKQENPDSRTRADVETVFKNTHASCYQKCQIDNHSL